MQYITIGTSADLVTLLADESTHNQAMAYLQALLDEQYGYNAAGAWGLIGGGGLERLGVTRAEAVALGALDQAVPEPDRTVDLTAWISSKTAAIQTEKCRVRDGGFDVNGVLFDSDQAARTAYLELDNELRADAAYTTPWKASENVWVNMDAALYAKVLASGKAHVSSAFAWQAARDAEVAAIQAAVTAGTMTAADAIAAVSAVSASYSA